MLLLLLIIYSIAEVTSNNLQSVPVFIIDTDKILSSISIDANPLLIVNKTDFINMLKDIQDISKTTVVFVEDKLCVEDLTTKDKLGTPFYHLQQSIVNKAVKYIPAVEDAYKTLIEVMPPQTDNEFRVSAKKLQLTSFSQKNPYYYVYFQDAPNGTRSDVLRQHDLIMKEVYVVLRKFYESVVAIYTGITNPVTVTRSRQKPRISSDTGYYKSDKIWVKLASLVRIINGKKQSFPLQHSLAADTQHNRTARKIQTNVSVSDMGLSFDFKYDNEKWDLRSVALMEANEEVGRTKLDISAPLGQSYACSEPINIINLRDRSTFVINKYQVEVVETTDIVDIPKRKNAKIPDAGKTFLKTSFSEPETCKTYFSMPILSGLFLMSIWFGVLFYGISSLMACNTNNRYDDPLGKILDITEHT